MPPQPKADSQPVKVIIISDTFIQGQSVKAGTVLDFDVSIREHEETLGMLNHAGRVAIHGSPEHEDYNDRAAADKAEAAAQPASKSRTPNAYAAKQVMPVFDPESLKRR